MNPVLEQAPPPRPTLKLNQRMGPTLTLREVGYGYRPGGSLGLSILAHQLAVLVVIFLGRYAFREPSIVLRPKWEPSPSASILVLPALGGGREGSGEIGGGRENVGQISSGLRARSRRGFAYPGPQPLVSNPPQAIPGIQTILQPSLENLPRLRRYLELPNIVQPPPMVDTGHDPPMVIKSGKLTTRREEPIAAPQVTLPVASNSRITSLIESKPRLPHKAIPDPVEVSEVSTLSNKQTGLLVLNAIPPPPEVTGMIPRAEARSLFAVSSAEATIIADPASGTKAGGSASMAAGSGSRTDIRSGNALAEEASGGDPTKGDVGGSGSGSGGRYGSGHGSGLNSVSNAGNNGRGSGAGSGLGTGLATGAGSGMGAGSAPGTGGFPGITIQGGRYGNTGNMLRKSETRPQSSYNMTIVSTAGSGGGLPDLGIFRNEKVYTVYLDMRSNDDDLAPSWTLQYAVLQSAINAGDTPSRVQGLATPPYATLKQVPQFAPELLHKCAHAMIVASAILDTGGKLQEVAVRQTPETQLTGPLVEALKDWIFEPAKIDGRAVAVKVLLGIRLAVPR